MLPTRAPVLVVFLGPCFLIAKASRPMLTIFAAAMASTTSIGATSPTRSPRIIVNIFIINIFILVSLKLLVDDRGLGKVGGRNARASILKPQIYNEARRLYHVGNKM